MVCFSFMVDGVEDTWLFISVQKIELTDFNENRGLRPTQAWLLLRAAPAQRHLLRTLTQLLGPPCETGTTACCRLSLPLCRRLLVRARDRGHNRSDVSRI